MRKFRKSSHRIFLGLGLICLAFVAVNVWNPAGAVPGEPDPSILNLPLLLKGFPYHVSGKVIDADGPLPGATVRVKATENKTTTDNEGKFYLTGIQSMEPISVTAWLDGYYVGWVTTIPSTEPVTITLKPYYTTDNPDYEWFSHEGDPGSLSCSHCMPCYTEWTEDAHSGSAVNPRLLTMYNGSDIYGNQSPPTEYLCIPDYGCFPLPPDLTEPYYGPGYKLDFPESDGNCATCHAPADAAKPGMAYNVDLNELSDIGLEGVFCEFCHKIGDVRLDPQTQRPYNNLPGVLSMSLFRPEEGQQLFFGNFDDVTRRVSYLPLMEESAYCAPCHYGLFWDVPVYNSYGEWLDSPYSDPETGQTCQDCHMPSVDYDYIVYPEQGGLTRDRSRIFSHLMPGATDEELLQNSLTMTATAQLVNDQLDVQVILTNDQTGHMVPTDSPLRHLILTVEASEVGGSPLSLLNGPLLPQWCGEGDPAYGYYAGLPGTAYAKILQEAWTNVFPTGSYWNQVILRSDNRLGPFESDTTRYTFSAPAGDSFEVDVNLWYRRAFIELMDWKSWDDADILMENAQIVIPAP